MLRGPLSLLRPLTGMASERGPTVRSWAPSLLRSLVVTFLLLSCARPCAAGQAVAATVGWGASLFDGDFMRFLGSASRGYEVPLGLALTRGIAGSFSVGARARVALVPFRWDYRVSGEKDAVATVSQHALSLGVRHAFGRSSPLPYLEAGVGFLVGSAGLQSVEHDSRDESHGFRPAWGMCLVAGCEATLGDDRFWCAELVLHVVRRRLDLEGYPAWRAHSLALNVGVGRRFSGFKGSGLARGHRSGEDYLDDAVRPAPPTTSIPQSNSPTSLEGCDEASPVIPTTR